MGHDAGVAAYYRTPRQVRAARGAGRGGSRHIALRTIRWQPLCPPVSELGDRRTHAIELDETDRGRLARIIDRHREGELGTTIDESDAVRIALRVLDETLSGEGA